MADVKWIKIVTDIFDDEKMLLIDSLPDHDSIIVIWFKILCLAGKTNNSGVLTLNDKIPFTDEMLATIFRRPVNTVRLALNAFKEYGMIEIIEDVITIPNWDKHQNLTSMESEKEKTRKRVAAYRERQKQLIQKGSNEDVTECNAECNAECNVTVTECNAVEEDKIREEEEEEREVEGTFAPAERNPACPFSEIKSLFHSICISYPKIKAIEGNRRKAVSARWRTHPDMQVFKELFTLAESSSFMKGKNKRNWSADFDWMMCATNFEKILEHKYDDDKPGGASPSAAGKNIDPELMKIFGGE